MLSLTTFSSVAMDFIHFVLSLAVPGFHVVVNGLCVERDSHIEESLPCGEQIFTFGQLD